MRTKNERCADWRILLMLVCTAMFFIVLIQPALGDHGVEGDGVGLIGVYCDRRDVTAPWQGGPS